MVSFRILHHLSSFWCWANFHCCKCPNIEPIIQPSGHTVGHTDCLLQRQLSGPFCLFQVVTKETRSGRPNSCPGASLRGGRMDGLHQGRSAGQGPAHWRHPGYPDWRHSGNFCQNFWEQVGDKLLNELWSFKTHIGRIFTSHRRRA